MIQFTYVSSIFVQTTQVALFVFEKFQYFYDVSKESKKGNLINVYCNTPTDKQQLTADQWRLMGSERSCWRQMNQQEMELQTGSIPPGGEIDSPPQLKLKFSARHCSPVTQHWI